MAFFRRSRRDPARRDSACLSRSAQMSSLPQLPPPDGREQRLEEIRREAAETGFVGGRGIRPAGSPFPLTAPESGYYEMPLLKEPQWKWEVPVYLFVGGAAGAAAVIGAAANLVGNDRALSKDARWLAAVGGALSAPLLIADLGVPSRFLNMLRVFKLQSPMSVGAWTMTAFSSFSAATAFAGMMQEHLGPSLPLQIMENAGEVLSAVAGSLLTRIGWVRAGYSSSRDYRIPLELPPASGNRLEGAK